MNRDSDDQLLTQVEGGTKGSDKDGTLDYLDKDSTLARGETPAIVVLYDLSTKSDLQLKKANLARSKNAFKGMLDDVEK